MPIAPLAILMACSLPLPADAGILVASNTDARTVLGFAVPPEAVGRLLPEGWILDAATSGPAKDINLRVTFIETGLNRDAEGAVLATPRIAHLSAPARREGSRAGETMLLVAFSTGGSGGPYGNSIEATAVVERTTRDDPRDGVVVDERWAFRSTDGDSIELHLRYPRRKPAMTECVENVHSSVVPHRWRTYHTEQAVDRIFEAGANRIQRLSFAASGPRLSPLFAGSERVVGVTSIPWYSRRVYLPASRSTNPALP